MKPKTHKIRNLNDMFKVLTLENYDRFTADFLIMTYNILLTRETLTEEEQKGFRVPYYTWIDDNQCRTGYKFNDKEIIWSNENK